MQLPPILRRARQERFAEARLLHPDPRVRARAHKLFHAAYWDADRMAKAAVEPYSDFG
ncbi:hypothetical protein [Novosphingobium olei]|uniref:Uncharacterized protein n=1 Tax=Novosphingobium olei TaxID=2728851 RepID=A0A7Y0BQF1_9SPHN|nr:hypothetical protein [Novosphingobium olei]NML94736.1 hypothetical protein [Novosphingobium olei]